MSSTKKKSIKELSQETQIEVDELLIKLWDNGINNVKGPDSIISGLDLRKINNILQIPTSKELKSLTYWKNLLKMDDDEFYILLDDLKIQFSPQAKVLPKGSIKKLKREANNRFQVIKSTKNITKSVDDNKNIEQSNKLTEKKCEDKIKLTDTDLQNIGHEREIRFLTEDEVKGIHFALVKDFEKHDDPIEPSGVRNDSIFGSAIFRPQTSHRNHNKYLSVETAGAAMLDGIIHDHPFHNGNKRTALVSLIVFLDENGFVLTCDENMLFQFVLKAAQHKLIDDNNPDAETHHVAKWICHNSRQMEHGEKLIPFHRLRQILNKYDCNYDHGSSGSKMKIERKITKKTIIGSKRTETLKTSIYYGGEEKEVDINTIKKIRKDLYLSDEHGIDSKTFYDTDSLAFDEFISKYFKTLNKLAKL